MQSQARWLVAVILASVVGGVAGAFGTLALVNRDLRQSAPNQYYGVAVNAALELRRLNLARSPTNVALIDDLERSLDARVFQLATFEDDVAAPERNPYVYSVIGRIQAYRELHPTVSPYPAQRERIERTLELGIAK